MRRILRGNALKTKVILYSVEGTMPRISFGLITLICALALTSCAGYRMGDSDRQIPGGYRTVAIPVFKNKSMEAGVEAYFTNALVREFERGRVGRVTSKSEAQTTLEGSIDNVNYVVTNQVSKEQGGGFLGENIILNTEYRILLQTTLRLRRNSDQKVLWEGTFNGERSYLAPQIGREGINSADAIYNQSARYQNLEAMASYLMNEAHNRITENF
jgi:hypothetical protein